MPNKIVFLFVLSLWPAASMAAAKCEFCQSISISVVGQKKDPAAMAVLKKKIAGKGFTLVERQDGLQINVATSEKEQELRSLLNRENGERAICKQMFKPGISSNGGGLDDNPGTTSPAN